MLQPMTGHQLTTYNMLAEKLIPDCNAALFTCEAKLTFTSVLMPSTSHARPAHQDLYTMLSKSAQYLPSKVTHPLLSSQNANC